MTNEAQCPFSGNASKPLAGGGIQNRDWWPNQLRLELLNQHSSKSDPLGRTFNYREEFKKLDYDALKNDLRKLMTNSQDWWPADFGHYGPQFIRMAWHAAGTYRLSDGRGGGGRGQQRFAPLNSWPDNVNIDKSRRLLWPIKQKYGQKISWADLLILAGNVALESMGFRTFGFAAGREDVWEPDQDVNWGAETAWLTHRPLDRDLHHPLGATEMGLIYVNPEGPNANGDPLSAAAIHPRNLQPHGDERRGNRRADRRRPHLRQDPRRRAGIHKGPAPEAAGWKRRAWAGSATIGTGHGDGRHRQRPGSHLDTDAGAVEQQLLRAPVQVRMGADPAARRRQSNGRPRTPRRSFPTPHDPSKKRKPTMLTTDLSLRFDPVYEKISRRFLENPQAFAEAFARAWFKLTHRDLGPRSRYLGPEVPKEELIWQDPVPAVDHPLIDDVGRRRTQGRGAGHGSDRVRTGRHRLGLGLHLPRRRQARRGERRAHPSRAAEGLGGQPARATGEGTQVLEGIQKDFNAAQSGQEVSLADLIVLGGCAGVEQAAKDAGIDVTGALHARPHGRLTGADRRPSFAGSSRSPTASATISTGRTYGAREELLVDKAQLLTLTAPEMTVLVGGLRVIDANVGGSTMASSRPAGQADQRLLRQPARHAHGVEAGTDARDVFEGRDRKTDELKWTGTRADLVFGSTRCCALSPRSMPVRMRRRSS